MDDLVPLIAAGDAAAFGRWVAAAEPRVRASLSSFATRVDTEAVVQETLLRVWQVAPRFQPDGKPDGLTRLAVRIARNLAISEVRRARVDPVEVERLAHLADADAPPPARPDPLLRQLIQACLERLPPKPRSVLQARLQTRGGLQDGQIADTMGMKRNTFVQNLKRARQGLQACLEGQGVSLGGAR